MKKIICLLLSLVTLIGCTLALASCGGDDEEPITLYDIARTSVPTKSVTIVNYTTYNGEKYDGYYSLEKTGDNAIFDFNYYRPITPDEAIELDTTDWIYNFVGKVYYKDGKYSTDGKTYTEMTPPEALFKFNLTESNLTGAVLSEDGKKLEATVTPSNAVAIFGSAIKALGDVKLTVETDGTYLRTVTITYKTQTNASVTVSTSYSYNVITLDFPAQEG